MPEPARPPAVVLPANATAEQVAAAQEAADTQDFFRSSLTTAQLRAQRRIHHQHQVAPRHARATPAAATPATPATLP